VNIEARMEEIVESGVEELGLVWGSSYSLAFGPGFSILPAAELSAKLNVLHTQNKAFFVDQKNTTCLDSQQGTIFMGEKYPVARLQIVEGKEVWAVEYTDIGTKLVVKPRVNKENIVTVSVKAEVSSIVEYIDLGPAGKYPLIRSRSTESLVRLKDGQTFVLTGLVQRDDKTEQTGIPLLDRLPILSALFKNKKTEKRSTVICLFLTPRIQPVTEEELAGGTARAAAPAPTAPGSAGEGKKDQAGPSKEKEAQGPGGVTPAPAAPTPPPPSSSTPKTGEGTAAPVSPAPSAPETAETESQDAASAPQPQAPAEAAPAPQEGVETPPATPPVEAIPAPQEGMETPLAEAAEGGTTPATPSGVVEETALPAVEMAAPSTPPSPAEAPAPAEAVGPVEPQPPAAGPAVPMRPEDLKEVAYTVKKGDTLFSIAKKFGVEAKKIADYNKLKSSSKLHLGQVLRIPIPDSHKYVVKPKETLWRIAKRYGVSVELLAEINGLADPTKLEVGQVLILPCEVSKVANPNY
ncbi:MAG: LysM peptidoglycan-binding domain-containing protein, partial [Firmicutes bacterium]|nr:LysM peptidoglycan-binding domain-containing protein [Bacillota bacterium]